MCITKEQTFDSRTVCKTSRCVVVTRADGFVQETVSSFFPLDLITSVWLSGKSAVCVDDAASVTCWLLQTCG